MSIAKIVTKLGPGLDVGNIKEYEVEKIKKIVIYVKKA